MSAHGTETETGAAVHLQFDGRTVAAQPGQTIAAALYAAGQRTFTRSFKYHRPRGLFCVAGECPNCLMEVDGRPNVRTCVEPVRNGQIVSPQNVWPTLGLDVLRVFDKLDRFLPVGFYYKSGHKPRWAWPLFEHVVRHVAGLGRVDLRAPSSHAEVEHLHAGLCVIGGGPAGLAAATAAAAAGVDVLLLERAPRLGGHLLFGAPAAETLGPLLEAVPAQPRLQVRCDVTAFGLYEGNRVGAFQGDRLLKVRARQVLVCTGGREQPYVFHNNDLPGVFLGRGVQRLARLYNVHAGARAVVVSDHDGGLEMGDDLDRLGITVAAVIDPRPLAATAGPSRAWPVMRGHTVIEARGGAQLSSVRVGQVQRDGSLAGNSQKEIACDVLCMASPLTPANELALQAGVRYHHRDGRWQVSRSVAGATAAGAAAGTVGLDAQILEGRLRGLEAAAALGAATPALDDCRRQWQALSLPAAGSFGRLLPHSAGHKRFVCLCEDVTEKDLEMAVAEGFDEIETLKRYSTVNMGPCQGKVCGTVAAEVCGRVTCRDLTVIGTTTSRPPVTPVEMRVLAADRLHPVRRTPMHDWHEAAGARWTDAGLWKRPEFYGSPAAEVRSVREAVGIIDVSTLGKIELIGPDAAELLERTYLNRWADLKEGRARYGVSCTDEGIVFDDGVATRLGPEHFYLTATTGNAETVVQWLERWRSAWRLDVVVLNRTSAVAAVNLAGPRAREVLGRLTAVKLSPEAFPYLGVREGPVAGVACRIFRIGFVGELGYEIHVPAAAGLHLWESLVGAGADQGLRPFGVEAQRILRLEKGHIIVGVDTDALSNPLEAGLGWAVHFDKPRFHGREPLLRMRERGLRARLVGFHSEEPRLVPEEGCQVIEDGRPAGRVTSARFSPTLGRGIGLAWVPAHRSRPGSRFTIRRDGGDVAAVVAELPFYDPTGARVRG